MNGFESFLDRVAAAQWGLAPLVLVALAGLSLLRARPATRVALAAILAGASLFAVAVPPLGDPGRAIEAVRRDLAATTGSVVDRAPIPKTPEPESSVAASPSSVPSRPTASTEGRAVPRPPTWLWLVVTSWLFARSAWAFVAARSRLRRLRPAPAAWLSEVRAAARALDVTVPRVAITRERASPAVFVAGRPVLVLPEGLLAGLDRTARRALLLHELAHLKRGDATWRGVVGLACALAWWNPLLWWLRSVVRSRAEDACDAWVARKAPESRESYARLLLDAERFAAGFRVRVRPAPAAIPMSSKPACRRAGAISPVRCWPSTW